MAEQHAMKSEQSKPCIKSTGCGDEAHLAGNADAISAA